MSMAPDDGISILRNAAENAREIRPDADGPPDLGAPPPDHDGTAGDDLAPTSFPYLPPGCPVVPLGTNGKTCYYLDELGQLQDLAWKEHSRLNIEGLFGRRVELVKTFWGKTDEKGRVKGWRPEDAAQQLKAAAAYQGVWTPTERVRGAGAWMGADGELILHLGNEIGVFPAEAGGRERWEDPGVFDGFVYPCRPAILHPAKAPEPAQGAGAEILAVLRSWQWARPEVDPFLMLGHVIAGVLGGALKWRPLIWVTGGKGTGKSTLHEFVRGICPSIISTSDASSAGVWQKVGYDSRPVAIDEAESDEDNRRLNNLLALARQAASGGVVLRGGSDHQGHEFTARSTFMFSSIGMPPLLGQDLSRMAILELRKLPAGAKAPKFTARQLEDLGKRLLRRIVDGWPRFADTLAAYREAMEEGGHTARGADVFGTLLACMDLALYDRIPDPDALAGWTQALKARDLAELAGDMAVENSCLLHLLTKRIEAYKGGQTHTVGEWIKVASGLHATGDGDMEKRLEAQGANEVLRTFGMEVRAAPLDQETRRPKWEGLFLWVAYRHTSLATIFDRTQWQGRPGATGGWVQHLSWLPGTHTRISFWCGAQDKAVLIPLDHCLKGPPGGGHDDQSAADGSPGHGGATGTTSAEASHRSAADTASSSQPQAVGTPTRFTNLDPFALSDDD